ncbi:hypothetical protein PWT90_09926 [Aphanocladium album]|nr:hypothetical protein PWT90_09926 [Aphanocladium album]
MAITTAISDLIHFVFETIASVFRGVYGIIHGIISSITGLFSGLLQLVGNTISSLGSVVGSITSFVTGNIVILGVGAVLAFFFLRSTATGQQAVKPTKAKQ